MVEKKVVVKNETGLHARPAAALVQFVKGIPGDVELVKEGKVANAKSIFSVMSLGISKDTEILVRVTGEDEEEHCEKVVEFIENLTD
ncbi:HPr family phosphocarrier protein [Helcococcus kunzii]|uniref:Phosphocarrier protein HPr n=1 Tax=Helcococcus kunzii ATCC 51366 TaxID=883114 RepID=H3NNF3_9FIRM|nr:HPr family phosphocarrier protein [Helcococcus kunzii]EHR33928.1 HPr family phosphocarrier [Helcococcus kunzii ATCC 51366]MCT1795537.1 HPr family phosphocarrier protein [Helcococcus kunzii]MCT1989815.1 HPr family phosphocarrier protein [Helcococcus kunzii]QUY64779.1 HPr family phosphocarrier protein [Helcococcus kunzii]QZO77220.1 HPr family phosphocarrier protein [Helcococcus kunzii]